MLRSSLVIFGLLLGSTTTYGQRTLPADSRTSETLEALLEEVRQLRRDLRTTTVSTVRAQILLHRVELQEAAVARLSQKVESAQARLNESQAAQQRTADQIRTFENQKESSSDSREQQRLEQTLASLRRNLQQFDRELQQRQAAASEAQEQLRGEQDKLSDLQDQLDRLDKDLEKSVVQPSNQ